MNVADCQVDTHIAGIFLSLLCKVIPRSDHGGETSFPSLLLILLSIGNLQTENKGFVIWNISELYK